MSDIFDKFDKFERMFQEFSVEFRKAQKPRVYLTPELPIGTRFLVLKWRVGDRLIGEDDKGLAQIVYEVSHIEGAQARCRYTHMDENFTATILFGAIIEIVSLPEQPKSEPVPEWITKVVDENRTTLVCGRCTFSMRCYSNCNCLRGFIVHHLGCAPKPEEPNEWLWEAPYKSDGVENLKLVSTVHTPEPPPWCMYSDWSKVEGSGVRNG